MLEWIVENYIEILGVLLSISYLILSIRQNILLWPVGILSAFLYVIVFFNSKFYADMALNVYYLLISIYGWLKWSNALTKTGNEMKVVVMNLRLIFILLLSWIALTFAIGYILQRFTDSPIPYWDAFTTAGSIIATWMLTKKILQHWLFWIVIDIVSMFLYIKRGLYPTAVLFLIYTIMAFVGYLQWQKSRTEKLSKE